MRKRSLAIPLTVAAVAAAAGGAYAATQSGGNPRQAFLDDVAARLHVSPAQLQSALRGALTDRLNEAVKAGRLTAAQAKAIEQRLESGRGPFMGPRWRFFGEPAMRPRRAGLDAAARYLGLTDAQLMTDLEAGKTLAQIAQARGRSVSGLEQAILSELRTRLDRAAAAGLIDKAQEQRILSRWSARIARVVEHGLAPMMARPRYMPPGPVGGPPPAA